MRPAHKQGDLDDLNYLFPIATRVHFKKRHQPLIWVEQRRGNQQRKKNSKFLATLVFPAYDVWGRIKLY